jgi:3-hydroxyisobutyrate dehydrogenase-like beta-hydroxyacid dehydrogenase
LRNQDTLLLFMVNNVEQVESILFNGDFYKAIQENSTLWIASTLPLDAVSSFEERLQARQIKVLDGRC